MGAETGPQNTYGRGLAIRTCTQNPSAFLLVDSLNEECIAYFPLSGSSQMTRVIIPGVEGPSDRGFDPLTCCLESQTSVALFTFSL